MGCDCEDCLGRTPYGSLVATILVCLGVGLFCGTGFRALDIVINGIFYGLFQYTVPWLNNIRVVFLILGITMGVLAIVLLSIGFISTGLTRETICSGTTCVKSGGFFTLTLLCLTYVINAGWMIICHISAAPILIWLMVSSVCQNEIYERDWWYLDNYCLNLSRFGIYRYWNESRDMDGLCDEIDLSIFCQHVYDAGPMFCYAFIGACFIVLGFVIYLTSFGSNYSRIRNTQELREYKAAIEMEKSSFESRV